MKKLSTYNWNGYELNKAEAGVIITAGVRGDEAGQYDDFESDNY